jgi:hypothetical protein
MVEEGHRKPETEAEHPEGCALSVPKVVISSQESFLRFLKRTEFFHLLLLQTKGR